MKPIFKTLGWSLVAAFLLIAAYGAARTDYEVFKNKFPNAGFCDWVWSELL